MRTSCLVRGPRAAVEQELKLMFSSQAHPFKSQCMLYRRPGLLLRSCYQPAHGGLDIPAPRQDRAAHMVRRFALQSWLWPRRERSNQARVLCVVVLGRSWLELAAQALL